MRRIGRRAWLVLGIALLLGLASALAQGDPPRASAHALLVRAVPPVNAQVRDPPTQLDLYFSESLEHKFSDARVLDQNNNRVDDHVEFDPADDTLMHVFLKPLQPGYISVDWETVSATDGHRVSGSYPLTLLNPDGSIPPGHAATSEASVAGASAKPLRVVDRWLVLLAACLFTGAFAFLALITPGLPGEPGRTARSALDVRAMTAAGVALLLMLPATGAELLEQAHTEGASVHSALHTTWGSHWLEREGVLILPLLVLVLCAALPAREALRRLLAVVGLVGAGAYLVLSADSTHAAAGGGSFWATASDFVHLAAAAVWLGLLAMLVVLFLWARTGLARGERYGVLATAVQRFSTIAMFSVAALLITGTANGVIEIGGIGDMIDTGYGRTLALKLALMAPLLIFAAVNAYVLRPRMVYAVSSRSERGHPATLAELERRLLRGVRWELIAGVAVLAAAALLGQQTPTRGRLAAPQQGSGKFTETLTQSGISATLVIDPNQPGDNSFEVYLTGAVDTVQSVRLDFTPPGAKSDQARLEMDASNPPTFYVGKGPYLPNAGKWGVGVDLRRSTGSDLLLPFTSDVAPPGGIANTSRSGGAFASPISFTPLSLGLLLGVIAVLAAMVYGSIYPRERVGGYTATVVSQVSRRATASGMRPVWSLGSLLVVGVGLGLVIGGHLHHKVSQSQAIKGNPVPATQESIARGQVLFSQNCTICHGDDGKGDGPLAKTLPLPPANLYLHVPYHPDQFFFGIMTNGLSGIMPSFSAKMSEEDRWNVLNYLRATYSTPATQ